MPVLRELAQVVHLNLRQSGVTSAANNAVIERPAKKFREDGDDLKFHLKTDSSRACQQIPAAILVSYRDRRFADAFPRRSEGRPVRAYPRAASSPAVSVAGRPYA